MVEGKSHPPPTVTVFFKCCASPFQQADLKTSTGSPSCKLRTTNALHCLSPKARDDKTPFKTNLWVEGWCCAWAANKIHKEGPILKASEEVAPLMATGTRRWTKANTRLCKYEMTTERKQAENANPKQTKNVRYTRVQRIRSYTRTLAFSLCTKISFFLSTDAFLKFWKPHWSEANSKPWPSLHTLYEKDLGSKVSGFSPQMQSWTLIQKIAERCAMTYSKKANFFLVWQSFKRYRGRSKETLFRKHTLPVKCRSRTVQRKRKKNPSQQSFQHCV